ncbi:hypothetical protein GGR55DRAFT_642391 [Xylaria sp. FL0064]|nr:hypothetical protein GGR55DRAFT_642391 [Xylaria sp. FL0064]
MSMSTLSGKKIYPQRPRTDNSPGGPPLYLLQWPHWVYTHSTQCSTSVFGIQKGCRRSSTGDLTNKTGKVLLISPGRYNLSNYYRRTSTAVSLRHSSSGITKRREHSFERAIPLRLQTEARQNADKQAYDSASSSWERASDSSFHVPVGKNDDGLYLPNDAPSSEQRPEGSEGDDGVEPHEKDEQLGLSPSIHLDTEHHANLVAASDECRHLYQEYYERSHGDSVTETDDHTDAYWKWDRGKHQWFHKDAETRSIVWFMG